MTLRLIEVFVPAASHGAIDSAVEDLPILERWETTDQERVRVSLLVRGEHTEAAMKALEGPVSNITDARVAILPVEATVPSPAHEEDDEGTEDEPVEDEADDEAVQRVSLEELHSDVLEMSRPTRMFVVLVALASVVASVGLIRDNAAVVIGSMVIAPLIGPSMGMALSATLADPGLARVAAKANVLGVAAAAIVAFLLGTAFPVDPTAHELLLRSQASFWDVWLGLAVGAAGALAVTSGVSTALVGVMVAVALLPPLVAAGLFAGSGLWDHALGASLLLATYLIGINLAAIVTFRAQGIRPRDYWEAARARRSTAAATLIWVALLALLALVLWKVPGFRSGLPSFP